MTKQTINIGTSVNKGDGDPLRTAFTKINENFTELYTSLGLDVAPLNLGAFEFTGSTLSTTDSSAIVIDQAVSVTSDLTVGGDIVPNIANGGNLGSAARPWNSLYVSNNTIYIGGNSLGLDNNGNLAWNGSTIAHADGEFISLDALTDVNLGSPQAGDVLSYQGGYWTAATVDRLINGAYSVNLESGGVLRANVQGIVSDNQLAVEGSTLISIQTLDGPYLQLFNQGATKEINLVAWDGESLSAPTWSFDTDRTLTLPNDSSIKSATNIDITVDTPDSSTFNWRFGADGNLTLPQGGNISEGGGISGAIKLTPAGGANANQALLIYPTTVAEGDHIHLTAGGGTTELYLGDDLHFVKLTNDGFVVIRTTTADYQTSAVWGFSPDGTTSIPGDIKSDSNINIEINLSDSTLRRWSFGEDGELTLPEDAVVKNISGNLTIEGESYVIIDSATNGQIEIGRSSGVGAVILGNKSLGTNSIIDSDLFVKNGVYERFSSLADATGIVTHNCANGHIFYHTSPDALFTVNFTNLNLPIDYATSLTLIIAQGGTGFIPNSVGISGVLQTINWQGNVTPTPSTNRTDVVTFSIICTALNTYTVLGQLTGF